MRILTVRRDSMKVYLLVSALFLVSFGTYGQNKSWVNVLRSADSVYLIRHGLIKGTSITDFDSSGKEKNQPLFIEGKLNYGIVENKKLLNAKDIERLTSILSYKSNDVPDEAKCYVPLHAIILVKGQKISYIKMSFDCQIYDTSKDIVIPKIQNKTWKQLIEFFNFHGIK
jgi:hypothetical protein